MARGYGRVVPLRQLPTPCGHDAVAFGSRPVNDRPGGDFHPAEWTPSQAYECASLLALLKSPTAPGDLLRLPYLPCRSPSDLIRRSPDDIYPQRAGFQARPGTGLNRRHGPKGGKPLLAELLRPQPPRWPLAARKPKPDPRVGRFPSKECKSGFELPSTFPRFAAVRAARTLRDHGLWVALPVPGTQKVK